MADKYCVEVAQSSSGYRQVIVGYFDDIDEAQDFVKAVVNNFKEAKATISYAESEEK